MNKMLNLSPVPDHVPAELVIDYDFINDERFENSEPHDVMALIAKDFPPIFWTPRNGGHWVICHRDVLFEASCNAELFTSSVAVLPPMETEPNLIPLRYGDKLHLAYRLPLTRAFSPKAVKKMESKITNLANSLIDDVIDKGGCEFVTAISEVLPVVVFMNIMGIPTERLREFRGWVTLGSTSTSETERNENYGRIISTMDDLIRERQVERKDDLISTLLDCEIQGRPITFEEMQGYCTMLFLAGLDTVTNSMSFAVYHLAKDVALRNHLVANPSEIPDAIEELLRRYSVALVVRGVTRDETFGGVALKQGDRSLLLLPAGNLDERHVHEPTSINLHSSSRQHLAFNAGPHVCVGRHLARSELNILLREWLKRIPSFSLDAAQPPRFRAGFTLATKSLPLVW